MELVPEAISTLKDIKIHEVDVIDIKCSRGRSDAKVYLDPHSYSEKERNAYLKILRMTKSLIEAHCMQDQGWYRCPNLTFEFDEHFAKVSKIEDLFKQIAKKPVEELEKDEDES